jgi:probable HAF family extracellular repeat protein
MNTSISMKALFNASLVLLAAGGIEQRALAAEDTYRVTELRDITNKAHVGTVQAEHLNNLSQIVGHSTDATGTMRPTYWYHFFASDLSVATNGQMVDVSSINDRSEVAGYGSASSDPHIPVPVIFRRGKVEKAIVNGEELFGQFTLLNNRGEIAFAYQQTPFDISVSYWFNGVTASVAGTDSMNFANAINNGGLICGDSTHDEREGTSNPPAAWVSAPGGSIFALIPPLPGDTGISATDINDNNQVVGVSAGDSGWKSYVWQDGVASDLHLTLAGDVHSTPTALNNSTVIVGWSGDFPAVNKSRAVIWHNGTTRELTAQIDSTDPLKPFVKLHVAKDINDAGEIIAQGVDTRTGKEHAYFLRPMRLPNVNP